MTATQVTPTTLLPGVSTLGFGFDITKAYDFSSATTRLVTLDEAHARTVTEFGTEFLEPANVSHIDLFTSRSEFKVFESQDEFSSYMAAEAGVEASAWGFSAEFDASYSKRTEGSQTAYYGRVFDYVQLWQVILSPQSLVNLDPDFAADLAKLPAVFTMDTRQDFFSFFAKYGTHFVKTTTVGGRLDYSINVTSDAQFTQEEASANMRFEYDGVFASASGSGHAEWDKMDKHWVSSRTAKLSAVGGDPGILSGVLPPDDPSHYVNYNDLVSQWTSSVKNEPGFIQFTLQPISTLATVAQGAAVDQALSAYLNTCVTATARLETARLDLVSNACEVNIAHQAVTPPNPPTAKADPMCWIVMADAEGVIQFNENRLSNNPDDFDALIAEAQKVTAHGERYWTVVVASGTSFDVSQFALTWLSGCGIKNLDEWESHYPTWPVLVVAIGHANSESFQGSTDYEFFWETSTGEPGLTNYLAAKTSQPMYLPRVAETA